MNSSMSIFARTFGLEVDHVEFVPNAIYTAKKMRIRLSKRHISALQKSTLRVIQPVSQFGFGLTIAIKYHPMGAKTRQPHISVITKRTLSIHRSLHRGTSIIEEIIHFALAYGKDWIFETYAYG